MEMLKDYGGRFQQRLGKIILIGHLQYDLLNIIIFDFIRMSYTKQHF